MNNALILMSENAIDRIQGLGDAKLQLSDPDYWSSVGIIALTGILVVFLILAILIFIFWLMGTIFKAVDKSKNARAEAKKKAEAEKNAASVQAVQTEQAEQAEAEEESSDEEIVAVISAAIAAYTEQGFTIKSIRKHTSGRSAWSTAGISENTRPF